MTDAGHPDILAATAAIGDRLADIRASRRMKVSELARRAGVSSSLISQIERGTSKPSVATLFALSQILEVPVDSFFSDAVEQAERASATRVPRIVPAGAAAGAVGGERPSGVVDFISDIQSGEYRFWGGESNSEREVVRRGERAGIDIRGGVRWERLTPTPLDGVEFLELIYSPGAESHSQAYRHPGIELVLTLVGVMTVFLGFTQHDLYPGDSIAFPSSTPHRYVNLTDLETRAVTVILRDDLSRLPIRENPGQAEQTARS